MVSSSIDSIQTQVAPKKNIFSAENFGFNPIASQNFFPTFKSAQLVAQPQQYQPRSAPIQQKPLQYDIQTIHDANYRTYKPEDSVKGEEILSALKKHPSVAAYFKPASTNVEISHPLDYRKEEILENPDFAEKNYKTNAYIPGSTRIRRYTDSRQRRQSTSKHSEDDDEDPYDYSSDYTSRPKVFDSDIYSSAYKEEKDPSKEYEYPSYYDSGYDHKEYERIKELSEQQAAEIKQNPGNCQEVKKDGMTCMVCKDPKTGGNYESCSYVAEPKNNKYAYSKERKFDSNDEPDEPNKSELESDHSKGPAKYEESRDEHIPKNPESLGPDAGSNDGPDNYKAYYVHSSKPKVSAELRSSEDKDSSENSDSKKPYDYQKALPGFYTDNEPKKDVEHVLAEFKKKDRSSCKKVQKNGMTCYQCIDKSGLKHEECMFVSESAPKRSHLAYQELKEFTSKPATLDGVADTAESQIVTTSATPLKSAAIVVAPNGYGRKLKRKKVSKDNLTPAASSLTKTISPDHATLTSQKLLGSRKTKRSENSNHQPITNIGSDKSDLAPPEEFSGASKGAFWAETMPRYSKTLGVTLPEFMLTRSEHEASFDETVAGV